MRPDYQRFGFVVNPHAGHKKADSWIRDIRKVMSGTGITEEIFQTGSLDEVGQAVRSLKETCDVVFAVGGDGTAHHVAQDLINSNTAFGLIPNGSGNDYSQMLKMPRGVRSALETVLASSQEVSYNVIQVTVIEEDSQSELHRWSINTTGYGFDASVSLIKTKIPILKGIPLYLTSALASLVSYQPSNLDTDGTDEDAYRGLMVAAGVGEFEGGGFRIFPGASPSESAMHICEVREDSKIKALPLLIKAIGGNHVGHSKVRMSKAADIRLESDQPRPVHADGEVVSVKASEVRLKLVEKALKVIIPA